MIAKLWAKKIVEGDRTFADVPEKLKDQVRTILIESGYGALVI